MNKFWDIWFWLFPPPNYVRGDRVTVKYRSFTGREGVIAGHAACRKWIFFGSPIYYVDVFDYPRDSVFGTIQSYKTLGLHEDQMERIV